MIIARLLRSATIAAGAIVATAGVGAGPASAQLNWDWGGGGTVGGSWSTATLRKCRRRASGSLGRPLPVRGLFIRPGTDRATGTLPREHLNLWRARRDSNPLPLGSKPSALSK